MSVARPTVTAWIRRDDWPIRRRPPWSAADLVAIAQWRSGLRDAPDPGPDACTDAELVNIGARLKLSQKQLTDLRRELLAGEYVKRADCERAVLGLADMFVAALTKVERAIPPAMPDLTAEGRGSLKRLMAERFGDARRAIAEAGRVAVKASRAEADTPAPGRGRPAAQASATKSPKRSTAAKRRRRR